jgi:hypothetical protein
MSGINGNTAGESAQGNCPRCGYRLSNFRTSARCFNCDYAIRGSDELWRDGVSYQGLIWKAESIWEHADPLVTNEYDSKYKDVYNY